MNSDEENKRLEDMDMEETSKAVLEQITEDVNKETADIALEEQCSDETILNPPRIKRRKKKIFLFSGIGVFTVLVLFVYIFTNYFLGRINYEDEKSIVRAPSDLQLSAAEVTKMADTTNTSNTLNTEEPHKKTKDVYNILLIGEETIDSGTGRGRSDCMIVATINKKLNTLKLISFMRDSFVEIPGYQNNKMNASYQLGGGPLVAETIEKNFGIQVEGYIRVDFSSFESIIDKLGGVEITLTENEARYLNSTNYVSNTKYRTLKPGKQKLNGNQAMGYSRVRKVRTIDNEADDFGRTARQRRVLMEIINKYKSKNARELIALVNDLLPLATTNMNKKELINLLKIAISLKLDTIETLCIPTHDGYRNAEKLISGSMVDILDLDFDINKNSIKTFISEDTSTKSTQNPEESEIPKDTANSAEE